MPGRLALLVALTLTSSVHAQADRGLLTELSKVKAIDAHSHLLLNGVEPSGKAIARPRSTAELPLRLRAAGPEWAHAWKVLYKINVPDASEKSLAALQQARELLVEDLGPDFSPKMLDAAGIELAIVSGDPPPGPAPCTLPLRSPGRRLPPSLRPGRRRGAEALLHRLTHLHPPQGSR